jgi:regulator of microtubule dynamics protein 3
MRFAGFLVAALLAVPAVTPLAAQDGVDHVALGVAARDARDPRAALQHFQEALRQDSMNYAANWQGALALIDIGKETSDEAKSTARDSIYAMAEAYARRAVASKPDDADGHFALANAIGRASLTKGKKERVQRAAEIRTEALKAIQLNPRHDGAYHILGRWNAEIMRLSGVQKFFAKNFLGGDVFNQASWDGAVSNMEKAVELNPRRVYHRLDLAEIYVDLGRFSDARTQLQRVAALPVGDAGDERYKQESADLLRAIEGKKDS